MKKPISHREHRINFEIKAEYVFLIDQNGEKVGSTHIYRARDLARDLGMDLVQIAVNNEVPVCKIMDYGKFVFELKKNKAKAKKENKISEMKEIQLKPLIELNDYNVKLKKAIEFLKEGHKVFFVLKFKGRQNAHPEVGLDVLKKITDDTKEIAKVEQPPKVEGKRGTMLIVPLK